MSQLGEQLHDLQDSVHQAQHHLQPRLTVGAAKGALKTQASLAATIARQQKDLHRLEAQVERLRHERSGGGFPWGLILLAGGAYALYRSSPGFRDRVQDVVKGFIPGIEGNLARAGDAAKDAAQDVLKGEDPSAALRDAGQELRRAGEKAADQADDKLRDLKDQATDGAHDLKRDAQRAADDARNDLRRP
ncbi:YtxH domain-containing protein [Deinococcus sp. Leaf326]|uniref:YtxH domain-containing protein n=1 Tax=Deinococcus sp. Leaf326 TaxID=1736338 RepID=UPI000AEF537E|nr:YtxH domain-containing protein [Deinococcus sp. Leaf326]